MSEVLVSQEPSVERECSSTGDGFGENATRVLETRYLKKDESGACVESPAQLFRRVARAIAEAELIYDPDPDKRGEWENRFYSLMTSRRFMPNSPTLMNAGRELGMLSACFVLPVPDSIDGIFDSIKYTALIQKAGGGTGFAFDELRPTGDYIASSGGTTSGPISFWRAFSEATNAIQQGAFRRGANMGMMSIHHPDILKFLHAKQDLTQFTNYNISVKITDEWMDAFLEDPDAPHVVTNPRTQKRYYLPKSLGIWEYDLRSLIPIEDADPVEDGWRADQPDQDRGGNHRKTAAAIRRKDDDRLIDVYARRDMWDIIIHNAWKTGEPGVGYIDCINKANPTPHVGRMESTNPCGEQPLLPFEACNLGSINLARFVKNPCTPQVEVDWDALRDTVHESTRFLDDVIDVNRYPLPQIDDICKRNRKIGLGIMGFADALFMLGVGYDTDEGLAWGKRFMKFVDDEAHDYSERLAVERGCFPNWKGSTWDTVHHRPMRNATCSTVAPTGTISIIAACSGGVEPLYSLHFHRNVLKGQEKGKAAMVEVNSIFEKVARQRGILSEGMMDRIAKEGTLAHVKGLPEDVYRVFVCAHDIRPEWHVKMQAAFQEHCDAAISKTINFPETATVRDVDDIYRQAYQLRCKGVTVYRNGCRKHQPMALKKDEAKAPESSKTQSRPAPEPRDLQDIASGIRIRQVTPFGNMHVQITVDPKTEQELEVFAQLGKGGDLANSDLEAICRLISLWLRSGGALNHVIQQLKGIGSSLQVPTREGRIRSLGDGVAQALTKYARAKSTFGLQSLLLGRFDLAELGRDWSSIGRAGLGPNGNGKKNGNGRPQTDVDHKKLRLSAVTDNNAVPDRPMSLEEQYKVSCPDCQSVLVHEEGCFACKVCGYSQC